MELWSTRMILAIAGMTVAWLVGMGSAGGQPLTSEKAFKNVQALKGIPVDDFMGTMGLMSAALASTARNVIPGPAPTRWIGRTTLR